jgi:hypothetical protein
VFHAVVAPFTNHNKTKWTDGFFDLIADILYRTEHMRYESIAIPLLGTGNNGAPIEFVIDLLCEAIDEFVGQQKTLLHLQSVCIVHPDKQVQKNIFNLQLLTSSMQIGHVSFVLSSTFKKNTVASNFGFVLFSPCLSSFRFGEQFFNFSIRFPMFF